MCRMQRRYTYLNFEHLYRRPGEVPGTTIISALSSDKPFIVYEPKKWWSDAWDPMQYERVPQLDQLFFEQFHRLLLDVPMMSLFVDGNENSPYVQYAGWSKNCYLCFCADYNEDCLYGHSIYYSQSLVDCFFCYSSELCYECVHCKECYHVFFAENSNNCRDAAFLFDCQNCHDCFGCVGLRNKEYCLLNVQLTKETYAERLKEYPLSRYSTLALVRNLMAPIIAAHPRKAFAGLSNENVSGDYLYNCKNCFQSFDCTDVRDCRYCHSMRGANDCMDVSHWGHPAELCYECLAVGEGASHLLFCNCCWPNCSDLLYCMLCMSCHNCFGCVGLRHKQYCVFNKEYSKEEYEELVPKMIERMRAGQEWGEFFPITISPYCYNESPAQRYLPLIKQEVLAKGWKWKDPEDLLQQVEKMIAAEQLPDAREETPEELLQGAIICGVTGRPFKIIKQEWQFYCGMHLPLPRVHPDERMRRRMALQNPRTLWDRECAKCQKPITTTYAPERPEIVYCESCYLATVY